ncbi:hypothetical protein [Ralstonia soli]|uniref:Type VI secretion protein n=1 Tax=Ralstonia soli TaxID=2953896 RepID=A0ABT1AH71_9RALS|nr:hypothetical protein [Ralstonia soli]MCO5397762.1 hypothetical protein [Ralstonia soli]
MAVDFSLLPPEETFDDPPPNKVLWSIVFVVLAALCVGAVLLLWPKGMPAHTLKFWATLLAFPIGVSSLVVLHRYRAHEARKLDVETRNHAARQFTECVFNAASIPLAVAGAAYRYSADEKENALATIREGSARLKTQVPYALAAEPVKARWLVAPEMRKEYGDLGDDLKRRQHVTQWLFDELLGELSPHIEALPAKVPLTVQLLVANGHPYEQNKQLLEERWCAKLHRAHDVAPEPSTPADLTVLDQWMDRAIEGESQHATLYLAIQLHPLLHAAPPENAAEVGVALLLMPDAQATQHNVARVANLHRPVRGTFGQPSTALSTGLRWGGAQADQIQGGWQAGIDVSQAGMLREPAIKLGLTAHATDLDQTVGQAGIAAPWLALACASLANDAPEQIVLTGQGEQFDCAVMKFAGTKQGASDTTTPQETPA